MGKEGEVIKPSKQEAEVLGETIKFRKEYLELLENRQDCNHSFKYSYGDNTSTTGPTGIWKHCDNCDYHVLVGHRGERKDVFYKIKVKPKFIGKRYHP